MIHGIAQPHFPQPTAPRRMRATRSSLGLAAAILVLIGSVAARADIFILQNDGRITGELIVREGTPKNLWLVKTTAGGEMLLDKTQIKQHIPQSPEQEEYERTRGDYADTVAGQWKLAEWCRVKDLNKQRTGHLERVIELDPNHRDARVALGYFQRDGEWTRKEERMQRDGYVQYKGKWLLPQEVELLEKQRATDLKQKEWYAKLNRLRADAIRSVPPQKAQDAIRQLKELDDPHAVPAILQAVKIESNQQLQGFYLNALGRIGSGPAIKLLVDLSLGAANENLRDLALDILKSGKRPEATPYFVNELKSKDNKRVNRAAYALGELGDESVVPALIDALVTVHKFTVSNGAAGSMSASFGGGGGNSGGGFGVGGKPQVIETALENFQALSALTKLTGQTTFDYNQQTWRNWYAANGKKPVISGRRD